MRGVVALAPGRRRRQAGAGGGVLRVDALGQAFQIVRGEQLLQRVGDAIRIAEQAAVAIGAAQGFHHVVRALHRLGLLPRQFAEHAEALRQGDAAGRGRWRADQLAAVLQLVAQRFALDRAVFAQVLQAPDAAGRLHAGHQLLGDLALVEADPPVARQLVQGARQFRLAQQVPFLRQVALVEEDPCGFRIVAHGGQAAVGAVDVDPVDGYAVGGQADRRHQVVAQRLAPVAAGDVRQRRRQAGDARGQRAGQRELRAHLAVALVHALAGGQRCALAGVDEAVGRRIAGLAQEEEPASAEARAVGFGHRQRGGDGHRRVEGVAAGIEGFQTGHGGGRMRAGDAGPRRLFGGLQDRRQQQETAGGEMITGTAVQQEHGISRIAGRTGE
ncbi:hypothetical protein D3C76_726820 [compost metagenome]